MSTMRVTTLKNEASTADQIVLNADGSFGGELATQLGSKLNVAGGKILQIVRATDSTTRSTTSTSYVDASISVTITPQKSDSAVLLIWTFRASTGAAGRYLVSQITDNSNNAISGSADREIGGGNSLVIAPVTVVGYATPATTSATTYKGRFRSFEGGSVSLANDAVGQLFAIEVSA